MAGPTNTTRMRTPFMAAFRNAHAERDAKVRMDERDEGGERVLAGRRATGRSTMTEAALHRTVSEDLEALMNTVNLAAALELDEHEAVQRSILNFGFPDIVHRTIDEAGVNDIGSELEIALERYEPRLVTGSVRVRRDMTVEETELKVRFVVRADLSCDPLNLPVQFVADLERDTGKITISRA